MSDFPTFRSPSEEWSMPIELSSEMQKLGTVRVHMTFLTACFLHVFFTCFAKYAHFIFKKISCSEKKSSGISSLLVRLVPFTNCTIYTFHRDYSNTNTGLFAFLECACIYM